MAAANQDPDVQKLHEMGYAQELLRKMGGFSNFAVSFTIISILSGCMTLYGYGMVTGGPVEMSIGWPLVGLMVLVVGLAMAELASSYPTAGGLYYWAAKLGGDNAPAWSWFTGWFNLLGQVAITAGIDFGLAFFVTAELNLLWPSTFGTGRGNFLIAFAVVLILHGILNTFGVRLVAMLNDISAYWHVFGVLVIALVLALVPTHHASASFVFTCLDCVKGGAANTTGFSSLVYVFLLGLLLAQYTFTGYDASAHMSEETHNAAKAAPRGIVWSIIISLIAGWILLLAVTFAIQTSHYATESTAAVPPAQIFLDAIGLKGTEFLLAIIIGAQFFCGMSSVTANSRMLYAFSRDGAVPGSQFWHHINRRTRTPTNSIVFAVVGAFLLGLPYYWNTVAYAAVTSIATIGLYVAYVTPVFLRLRIGDRFQPGPWSLGRWSKIVGTIAVAWVAVITVLFMLPTSYLGSPLDWSTFSWSSFNYTPLAFLVVIGFAGIYWLVSARNWFKGPQVQGTPEELAQIERELAGVTAQTPVAPTGLAPAE